MMGLHYGLRAASAAVIAAAALVATRACDPGATAASANQPARDYLPPVLGRSANGDSLAALAIRRNLFRVHRTAARARYGEVPAAQSAPASSPQAPRPPLVLAGVVLGSDTAALIEGLPGVQGARLLRSGEQLGEFRLVRVTAEQAVIAAPETTYVIRIRSRP